MSGYQISSNAQHNFDVNDQACANCYIPQSIPSNITIVYATFQLTSTGEFRIDPMNFQSIYGEFFVSMPAASMSIFFQANSQIKRVFGMMSFNFAYEIQQPTQTSVTFDLTGLPTPTPFFGTLSLMLEM